MSSARLSALVTGGSAGIGLVVARMLAEEGHALTLVARGAERLQAVATELAAAGAEVEVVAGNLLDEATLREAAERVRARHGRPDVLVNNAGVGMMQPLAEVTARRIDVQLGLDLRTPILLQREC